jgi:peptidoglycan/xylan/chitin deacetylase (PgdA/CDA1 family)
MWFEAPVSGRSLTPQSLVLSFDDGPGPNTVEIASYLAEERIQAMFFVVGRQARRFPDRVARLLQLGHSVGNHSENHLRLTNCSVSDECACAEFTAAAELLSQLGAPRPFFRPAYGAWNNHLAHLFNSHPGICLAGAGPVHWDIDGGDYRFWRERQNADACASSYGAAIQRQNRGVVLFHDFSADEDWDASRNRTLEMLQILIPRLRDMGYRFSSPNDIPALNAAAGMGLRCALQAGNGKYARVEAGQSHQLRAVARFPVGEAELRMYPAGEGLVRLDSARGTTLWPHMEILPLGGNRAAFRTPDGILSHDPVTGEIKLGYRPVDDGATFHVTALGSAGVPARASGNVGSL